MQIKVFLVGVVCALALTSSCATAEVNTPGAELQGPLLRHSATWVRARLLEMHAVDDAYLWHDVLKGRAIHQNSFSSPPTEPHEGNFHTQQQAFFALMKMHLYELLDRKDEKFLDDAKILLDWVLDNGYDEESARFYFKYNTKSEEWQKNFYPEFNIISVAALLRYNSLRPTPRYADAANSVFDTIIRVGWDAEHQGFISGFVPDPETGALKSSRDKGLYGSGYLAVMMLDAYGATDDARFLEWARKAVDSCNTHLWDEQYGGWFASAKPAWKPLIGSTKLTHVIADMIQANYTLFLLDQGGEYLTFAEEAMDFLAKHCRAPNGLWWRHTTRDGADPKPGPDMAADGGPGTCFPYDREMQVVAACCLGWRATRNPRYLDYVDVTLDAMETHHLIVYPDGVNYGYMGQDGYANTWCHLWGLKGFLAVAKLQKEALQRGMVETPLQEKTSADLDDERELPSDADYLLNPDAFPAGTIRVTIPKP